jgi:spore maturation protein CgeB
MYTDFRRPVPNFVKEFATVCDAVTLVHKEKQIRRQIRKECNQKNIHFIDIGANTDIYKPIVCNKKYDILFAANYLGETFHGSAKRLEFIHRLKDQFKDSFNVIGNGWPKDVNAMPKLPPRDLNTVINKSKITVGMSHFLDAPFYTSARLFQQMATGVPHIAWHSPRVKELFKQGYLEVSNYQDLFALIKKLLSDDNLRLSVGIRQFTEIRNNHSPKNFWDQLKKISDTI